MRKFADMKAKTFAWLLLAVLTAACSPEKEESLTVLSYNIRMGVADDGENSWQYRCPATKAMIEDQQPDVFGVQEAYDFQVAYIEENCPGYKSIGVGREDGISEGEHMSIFYRTDAIDVLEWGTYWLSETPDVPSMGWDAACFRTATWALMQCRESGRSFYFVNTHLDHVGADARKNGLALIVQRIAAMNPEGWPMILTGDFNVRADDPSLADLDQIMSSARRSAAVTDTVASFNAYRKPIETAALGNHLKDDKTEQNAIDYIYYTGFSACPVFETVTQSYAGVPFISDHYPVKARLVF